jgi:hypothetical protein
LHLQERLLLLLLLLGLAALLHLVQQQQQQVVVVVLCLHWWQQCCQCLWSAPANSNTYSMQECNTPVTHATHQEQACLLMPMLLHDWLTFQGLSRQHV